MSLSEFFARTLSSFATDHSLAISTPNNLSPEEVRRLLESATKSTPTAQGSKGNEIENDDTRKKATETRPRQLSASQSDGTLSMGEVVVSSQAPQATSAKRTLQTSEKRLQLAQEMLVQVVKRAFSRDRSSHVTQAGRKAIQTYRPPMPYDSDEIAKAKAWKNEAPWTVDVLEWCLGELDPVSVERNWHLLIPPILSLVDDIETTWRVRGCHLICAMLPIIPSTLLMRTGIGEVLEQALLPYLMHLPPLTEVAEALDLLGAVYPTLSALIAARFPEAQAEPKHVQAKNRVLDRIMREGILRGLGQVNDNVRLSVLLLKQLGVFVAQQQINCVKHLKLIIPMIEARLSGPFATASPEYLYEAIATLKIVQINAWPRISFYRMHVLSALGVAWCRIDDMDSSNGRYDLVRLEIIENIRILRAILTQANEGLDESQRILESDARLVTLGDAWTDASQ